MSVSDNSHQSKNSTPRTKVASARIELELLNWRHPMVITTDSPAAIKKILIAVFDLEPQDFGDAVTPVTTQDEQSTTEQASDPVAALKPARTTDIAQLYQSGTTMREIAARVGISERQVAHRLRREGIVVHMPEWSTEEIAEMKRLYESGRSLDYIAEQLSSSHSIIRRQLAAQGVAIRGRGPVARRKQSGLDPKSSSH